MSASEYRALLRKKREKIPTEFITTPSGMVWELRRPDLNAYIITGRYPQSLVNEGLKAMRKQGIAPNDPKAIENIASEVSLDSKDMTEALIFMRELVREACVNPKLVMGASKDDEIEPSEMDIEDFNFIVSWCVNYKGVKNAEGIATFRKGRKRGTARAKSDGEELPLSPIGASEH